MGLLCDTLQLKGGGVVSLVGGGGKTTLMFQLAHELAAEGQSVLTTTTTKIFRPEPEQSRQVVLGKDLPELLGKLGEPASWGLHVTAAGSELTASNKLTGYPPNLIDTVRDSGLFQWIVVEADGARGRSLKVPAAHEPVIPASTGWVIAMIGLDAIGKTLDDRHVFRAQDYSRLTGVPVGAPVSAESVVSVILAPQGILKAFPPNSRRIIFLNKADDRDRCEAGREICRSLRERGNGKIHRIVSGSLLPEPRIVESHDLLINRF